MTPAHDTHDSDRSTAGAARPSDQQDQDSEGAREHGRHAAAVTLVEQAIEPAIEAMGYELLLLEWITSGKRRVLRVYLDHPAGVSVGDCSKMSRIIGNTLDASDPASAPASAPASTTAPAEPADTPEPKPVNPALAALLSRPYSLEVSSPGVDRPLTRLRHFAAQIGGRVKLETWEPLDLPEQQDSEQRKFHGRITAVEPDPAAPEHPGRGVVVIQDADRPRELRIPLPRIRRANLVWEG
ncbi:ribosome maturation factor RimP [Enhygromyxa salina]|uniref:Ribosome maturation factor RimP n=1 Tax=Enhygromyxa salina TaxID=215803 RepID=A0A2S9YQY6_9BACT|nr:ribosome maturation factor RimP [Enhygromyxa salina]PRQ07496.1 Ribosome maturation factor RimP [Enhygromyxa salina]